MPFALHDKREPEILYTSTMDTRRFSPEQFRGLRHVFIPSAQQGEDTADDFVDFMCEIPIGCQAPRWDKIYFVCKHASDSADPSYRCRGIVHASCIRKWNEAGYRGIPIVCFGGRLRSAMERYKEIVWERIVKDNTHIAEAKDLLIFVQQIQKKENRLFLTHPVPPIVTALEHLTKQYRAHNADTSNPGLRKVLSVVRSPDKDRDPVEAATEVRCKTCGIQIPPKHEALLMATEILRSPDGGYDVRQRLEMSPDKGAYNVINMGANCMDTPPYEFRLMSSLQYRCFIHELHGAMDEVRNNQWQRPALQTTVLPPNWTREEGPPSVSEPPEVEIIPPPAQFGRKTLEARAPARRPIPRSEPAPHLVSPDQQSQQAGPYPQQAVTYSHPHQPPNEQHPAAPGYGQPATPASQQWQAGSIPTATSQQHESSHQHPQPFAQQMQVSQPGPHPEQPAPHLHAHGGYQQQSDPSGHPPQSEPYHHRDDNREMEIDPIPPRQPYTLPPISSLFPRPNQHPFRAPPVPEQPENLPPGMRINPVTGNREYYYTRR